MSENSDRLPLSQFEQGGQFKVIVFIQQWSKTQPFFFQFIIAYQMKCRNVLLLINSSEELLMDFLLIDQSLPFHAWNLLNCQSFGPVLITEK